MVVPVVSVVPVVPVVSFRRFRFGVSGFSTCLKKITRNCKNGMTRNYPIALKTERRKVTPNPKRLNWKSRFREAVGKRKTMLYKIALKSPGL